LKSAIASDFITFEPDNGKPIPENRKPKLRCFMIMMRFYIGAWLRMMSRKILKEITQRDNLEHQIFWVFINGFNDGQQDFQFFL
jgi:hypothetical protein